MSKIKEGDVVYLKTTGERVFVHGIVRPILTGDHTHFSGWVAYVRCSDYEKRNFLIEELETPEERETCIRKLYQPVIDALGKSVTSAKTEFQILEEMQGEDDPDDPTKIN